MHSPTAVRRIASAGTFVAALETLSQHEKFRKGDLLGSQFDVFYPKFAKRHPRITRALSWRGLPYAFHGAQAAVSAATFLWPRNRTLRLAGGTTLAALSAAQRYWNPYGRDGADQLQQVINVTLASTALIEDREKADDLAMRALALETTISYAASGVVKAVSPVWLKGDAVGGVLRTKNYGDPRAHRLITRYPQLSKALSWGTIAIECGFPLVYVLPRPAARAYLASMTAFHLGIGQLMGLNRFFLAFGATHPAIHYVLAQRRRELSAAPRPAAGPAA
ncbi:hypothetical protein D7294_30870 [Streptomyces hoynatensis]|uniref:HTTM-like domain-containing protein n=2 Tax=Streptomyces hoynatensis TaxID=1141874 RepID=A0A3A9YF81_9ACTN|nr:hypothetical protein D7294_30870 [Streptomyces hoynatensis]